MTTTFDLRIAPAQGDVFPDGVLRLDYVSPVDGLADWGYFLPGDPDRPVVVVLHGWGSTGDQLYTRADVREQYLPRFRAAGCGVLTPNLRGNVFMNAPAVEDLHGLLAAARRAWGARAFVFFGGSMGGSGNLIYAVRHPEDVAALAALGCVTTIAAYYRWTLTSPNPTVREIGASIRVAYGGAPEENPDAYAAHDVAAHAARLAMPVFLAHGAADDVIPVEESRRLAAAGTPGPFEYVEIPGGNHDSPLFIPEAMRFFAARAGR